MANLGEITEIVNSEELTLEVGSNAYIGLTDLDVHIGRVESRQPTTGGLMYIYGKGDNWFTATLNFSGPEIDGTGFVNSTTAASFNELTQLTSPGELNEIDWKILAKNTAAATKTFTATGVLKEFDVKKAGPDDNAIVDIFVRITGDTISIA